MCPLFKWQRTYQMLQALNEIFLQILLFQKANLYLNTSLLTKLSLKRFVLILGNWLLLNLNLLDDSFVLGKRSCKGLLTFPFILLYSRRSQASINSLISTSLEI